MRRFPNTHENIKQALGTMKFKIIRNNIEIGEIEGYKNSEGKGKRHYIGLDLKTDVQKGDILVDPEDLTFQIYLVKHINDHLIQYTKAYYYDELEEYEIERQTQPQININNAYNPIIGNVNNSQFINNNIDELKTLINQTENLKEKEDLRDLLKIVTEIRDGVIEPEKGILSKFKKYLNNPIVANIIIPIIIQWLF